MPTLVRTEMLALSLEKIAQTKEGQYLDVRIFLDTCPDEKLADVEYVRNVYLPTAEIFKASEHIKVLSGCYNILQSLKAGRETGKEFIFFIEEDVLIRPWYFDLHWRVHNSGQYFVVSGRRHGRMPLDFFSNPGSSYRRESLGKITPHINDEYFSNPEMYLNKHFSTTVGQDGFLDDGLIRKVQKATGGKVLCLDPPSCSHVGFRYYDRMDGYVNTGKTIQEKIVCLREMLSRIDSKNRYTMDFEPYI